MPTIEFRTFRKDAYEFFRPVAAKDYQPEWWKKEKVRVDHRGRIVQSIRSCPAMNDWLTMGYYIVATQDIPVRNGLHWDWPDGGERFQTTESHDQFSSSHPSSQLVDTISYLGDDAPVKDAFKISSPWNMKTPEGYSVLFLDPFMFTNKFFACWQGVIDTDEFNVNLDNAQIIFYPLVDHSFVIPAGTPLVQILPFQRETWSSTYFYSEEDTWHENHARHPNSMQKHQLELQVGANEDTLNIGGYRKLNAWKPKHKFFKSTEESPPPECPAHKDYNDKQRELTDLNWDGSESKTIDRD